MTLDEQRQRLITSLRAITDRMIIGHDIEEDIKSWMTAFQSWIDDGGRDSEGGRAEMGNLAATLAANTRLTRAAPDLLRISSVAVGIIAGLTYGSASEEITDFLVEARALLDPINNIGERT